MELPFELQKETPKYGNIWHVQSEAICSCSFRHAGDINMGFGEPEDWNPEDKLDINATLQFIAIVRELLAKGNKLDCFDAWQDDIIKVSTPIDKELNLSIIKNAEFRFFENYHFIFTTT